MGIAIFKNKIFGKIGIDFIFSLSLPMFFFLRSLTNRNSKEMIFHFMTHARLSLQVFLYLVSPTFLRPVLLR